jgi:hypothetical protein
MAQVIPFPRPPSKLKEDEEMVAFLKLLEMLSKKIRK